MYTYDLTLWGSLQPKWVVVAQVLLRGKGQLLNVLDGLNIIGTNVQFL